MRFVATFFSHFGAVDFKMNGAALMSDIKAAPVPRTLSSSCGTCVFYECDVPCPFEEVPEDVESISTVNEDGTYTLVYKAEDS